MFKKMNLQIFAEGSQTEGTEGNEGSAEDMQKQENSTVGNEENKNQEQQNNTETFSKEEYLKELGVEDEDSIREYIKNKKKEEEQNLTDLQKVQRTLDATTKELAVERKARMQAEAKLQAIKDGAKPELVDDLVAVAMTKATNNKSVEQVLAEMKKDVSRSFYYNNSSDGGVQNQSGQQNQNNSGFTRGRGSAGNSTQTQGNNRNQNNGGNGNESGSIAARLFARKYGKNNNQENK